ncbi:uncharacterized protein LOC131879610 [Tigriopus californicus]|uniref:uncharacterized protein LOC131879610 n=1 Tax=Tigriopus californicus TaxID=6832 RepID=UPI0027DA5BC6|nr:uncharacterized protein LOC131879610 [Tigriopus californicus]
MTDEVLGPFLVLESIISLMSQVFAFQPIQFTFGVAATFGAFHWFLRLFFLFESGQKIVRQMVHVRRNLEVIFMNGCDTRDNQTQHKLKILLKRFGNFYPIRPCGSFTLCRSSAISAGGVLLTYIIVLLEFRFSETDQKSCAHPPYWNATQPELLN